MRIGYCRVSTSAKEQLASAATQEERLRTAECDEVLVDVDVSGHSEKRRKGSRFPEFIERILSGLASEVVVPNFDRTQRRMRWGMELLDALEVAGIRLLELDTNTWIDPKNNPTDVLMAQIRTAVQENESRIRSLKVRQGIAANRVKGRYSCAKVPFGYTYEAGAIIEHPKNWPLAMRMWEQLRGLEFNCCRWVAQHSQQTGRAWTPSGVRSWIRNPVCRGIVLGIEEACPAIIDAADWEVAEAVFRARRGLRGGAVGKVYALTGLVACEMCGKYLQNAIDRRCTTPRLRLKCLHPACDWYGRGIREELVRGRLMALLATNRSRRMAELAVAPGDEPPEAYRLRQMIEGVEYLIGLGMTGQEAQLADLRRQLQRVLAPESVSRLLELAEVFEDPQALAIATEQQLRTIFAGLLAEVVWLGGHDPAASLRVTLR